MSFQNPLDPNNLVSPLILNGQYQDALNKATIQGLTAQQTQTPEMRAAALYPNAPQLKFDTNATGIGTGIVQGLGNAVNNYQQLKNYRTRVQMLDNAVLQQRDEERQRREGLIRQQEAAAQQEGLQYQRGREILAADPRTQSLLPYYDAADPKTRASILAETRGLVFKPLEIGVTEEAKAKAARDNAQTAGEAERIKTEAGYTGFEREKQGLDLEAGRLANQGKTFANIGAAVDALYAGDMANEKLIKARNEGIISNLEVENAINLPRMVEAVQKGLAEGKVYTPEELAIISSTLSLLANNDAEFRENLQTFGVVTKDKKGKVSINLSGEAVPGAAAFMAPPSQQRTPQGRAIIQNPDGSISTERTITVGFDDGYYNIPTMGPNGEQLTEDQAIAAVKRAGFKDPVTGRPLQRFSNQGAAVQAAEQRSQGLGQALQPQQDQTLNFGPVSLQIPGAPLGLVRDITNQAANIAGLRRREAEQIAGDTSVQESGQRSLAQADKALGEAQADMKRIEELKAKINKRLGIQ